MEDTVKGIYNEHTAVLWNSNPIGNFLALLNVIRKKVLHVSRSYKKKHISLKALNVL